MSVLSYSEVRASFKEVMDRVVADRSEVIITRQRGDAVVMLALSDWTAIQETLNLLSSSRNAARLRDAIDELDVGNGREQALVDA
jgi:antitoxin YefM